MSEDFLQRYKRSEYLKNGCRECKRRKIKCDEFIKPPKEAYPVINHQGRPLCWNCTRLKKQCEYPKKGEKVARISRKQMLEAEKNSPGHINSPPSTSTSPFDMITSRNIISLNSESLLGGEDSKFTAPMYLMPNGHLDSSNLMVVGQPLASSSLPLQNYHMSSQVMHNGFHQVPKRLYENTQYNNKSGTPLNNAQSLSYAVNSQTDGEQSFSASAFTDQAHSYKSREYQSRMPDFSVASNVLLSASIDTFNFQNLPKNDFMPNPSVLSLSPAFYSYQATQNSSQLPDESISSMLSSLTALNMGSSNTFEPSDLAVLATDLNNIVSEMMFEINGNLNGSMASGNLVFRDSPTGLSEISSPMSKPIARESNISKIPRNVGLEIFLMFRPKEQQYLEEFYHGFAYYILPFEAYDSQLKINYNPIRDILLACAAKEPVLLAAILFQSARACYTKTNSQQDEDASYQYLLKCLKILGPALEQAVAKDEHELISSIEGILLTVLLLTSANAANSKQNWRPHLKGAKDLLLKKAKYIKHSKSKVLILCKFWFASFEILAGLSLRHGGTLKEDEEMNQLLNFDSSYELKVLKELGLILENGFSLLSGFHNELTPTFRDLIKLLNKARITPKERLTDTAEYIRLLSRVEWYSHCEFVNSNCFVIPSSFANGVIPPGLLLEYVPDKVNPRTISWMDLSHQLYIIAAKVSILSELLGLSFDCPQVQALAQQFSKVFSQLAQLLSSSHFPNLRFLMIQWPLQVFGMVLLSDEDRRIVTGLYKYVENIGAGSAGHTMKRLEKIWQNRDAGITVVEDDEVDIVSY